MHPLAPKYPLKSYCFDFVPRTGCKNKGAERLDKIASIMHNRLRITHIAFSFLASQIIKWKCAVA
jgi:hypothetical protein